MGWFNILKVEDIDFDKDIRGFGHYAISSKPINTSKIFDMIMQGKRPDLKDLIDEEIRINHHEIYRYLRKKLKRTPTERELQEFVIRAIMHESTHAGMGLEQLPMDSAAKEYGAFTGQFPDNLFYRLRSYIDHPAIRTQVIPPRLEMMLNIEGGKAKDSIQEITRFIAWAEVITDDINADTPTKDKIKNKLARLELTARTQNPADTFSDIIKPDDINTWIRRYGEENKEFFEKISAYNKFPNREVSFSDEELKMVGAVTTSSAPAMFNKVVRGRKKRRKKDE
tara:strand:+ start:288 stop:1133 length:846 start_codon:yes stop_codon:yes gene_type:complete